MKRSRPHSTPGGGGDEDDEDAFGRGRRTRRRVEPDDASADEARSGGEEEEDGGADGGGDDPKKVRHRQSENRRMQKLLEAQNILKNLLPGLGHHDTTTRTEVLQHWTEALWRALHGPGHPSPQDLSKVEADVVASLHLHIALGVLREFAPDQCRRLRQEHGLDEQQAPPAPARALQRRAH